MAEEMAALGVCEEQTGCMVCMFCRNNGKPHVMVCGPQVYRRVYYFFYFYFFFQQRLKHQKKREGVPIQHK